MEIESTNNSLYLKQMNFSVDISKLQQQTEEKKQNRMKGIELIMMYIETYKKIEEVKKLFNGNVSFEKETTRIMNDIMNSSDNMYNDYHPKYIADCFDQLSRGIGIGKDYAEVLEVKKLIKNQRQEKAQDIEYQMGNYSTGAAVFVMSSTECHALLLP